MARDQPVTVYVEDDLKRELERNADAEDLSMSTYAATLLERQLHAEASEEISREHNAEERLNELIALGRDELLSVGTEVTELQEDIRELNAKAGVYAVASWELLKQDHGDDARRAALATGSERLRDGREPTEAEPEAADQADEREYDWMQDDDDESDGGDDERSLFEELREDRDG